MRIQRRLQAVSKKYVLNPTRNPCIALLLPDVFLSPEVGDVESRALAVMLEPRHLKALAVLSLVGVRVMMEERVLQMSWRG